MRLKFTKAHAPTEIELEFIRVMEAYDRPSITLLQVMTDNVSERKLRAFKESYNNYLYINHKPKGVIHQIGEHYVLVRPDDELSNYYRLKAEYDFVCSIIAHKNTQRTLGRLQVRGQMQWKKLLRSNVHDLKDYANDLAIDIENAE